MSCALGSSPAMAAARFPRQGSPPVRRNGLALGLLTQLERLNLARCTSLTSLPESVGQLEWLQDLILTGCTSLSSLPATIGQLTELIALDVRWCSRLASLPASVP